jgi:hypothetical protein
MAASWAGLRRQIRRCRAIAAMLSKSLKNSPGIIGKLPPGSDESSLRNFTYSSSFEF